MVKIAGLLAAHRSGFLLRFCCERCGHSRLCDPWHLLAWWGQDIQFKDLSRRLHCRKCGQRGGEILITEFRTMPRFH
jgi:hypothetical protein